jgi:hypothetical protein
LKSKVEKIHDEKVSELHGGYDDADYLNAYTSACDDIFEIFK